MPSYLICIGSNDNKEANLLLARNQLTALFPSIRFAEEVETAPFLLSNPAPFNNQVAQFHSNEGTTQVKARLKEIEQLAGRLPTDKAQEKIVLDIDLLMCDDQVLKPQDMEREYIKQGLASLEQYKTPNMLAHSDRFLKFEENNEG